MRNLNIDTSKFLKLELRQVIVFFFALRAVCNVWLAFDNANYSVLYSTITDAISILTFGFGVVYLLSNHRLSLRNTIILLPIGIFWIIIIFHTYGGHSIGNGLIAIITLVCFALMDNSDKANCFGYFYKIVLIQNIIGIIVYMMYMIGISFGFSTVPFYEASSAVYIKWFIFALLKKGVFLRLCGIFNEPGALGTICAFLFVATYDKMKIWERIVFLLTIVLTFSMAGYLLVFIFLGTKLFSKDHRNLLWLIPLGFFIFIAPNINWGNDNITFLLQRMTLTDSGLLGDNRTSIAFQGVYDSFVNSRDSIFGLGYRASLTGNDGSSYRSLIVQFGYVGTISLIASYIFAYVKSMQKDYGALIMLVIFIISLYQRPLALINLYGYVVMFGSLALRKEVFNSDSY